MPPKRRPGTITVLADASNQLPAVNGWKKAATVQAHTSVADPSIGPDGGIGSSIPLPLQEQQSPSVLVASPSASPQSAKLASTSEACDTSLAQAAHDIDSMLADLAEDAVAMSAVEAYWQEQRCGLNASPAPSSDLPNDVSVSVTKVTRLLKETDAWLSHSATLTAGSPRAVEAVSNGGDLEPEQLEDREIPQQSPSIRRRRMLSMRTSSVEQFFIHATPTRTTSTTIKHGAMTPTDADVVLAPSPETSDVPFPTRTTSTTIRHGAMTPTDVDVVLAPSPENCVVTLGVRGSSVRYSLSSPLSRSSSVSTEAGGEGRGHFERGLSSHDESWLDLVKASVAAGNIEPQQELQLVNQSCGIKSAAHSNDMNAALLRQLQVVVEKLSAVDELRVQAEQTVQQLQEMKNTGERGMRSLTALSLACVAFHTQQQQTTENMIVERVSREVQSQLQQHLQAGSKPSPYRRAVLQSPPTIVLVPDVDASTTSGTGDEEETTPPVSTPVSPQSSPEKSFLSSQLSPVRDPVFHLSHTQ